MKTSILTIGVVAFAIASCSEKPGPETQAIDGHWLYNPGQCEDIIDPEGMFDLKISDREIRFGDNKKPAEGVWESANSNYEADIKERISEWRETCDTFSVSESKMAQATVFRFDGKYQQATFLNYGSGWFMADEEELFWLVPFEQVKNSGMAVKTIEKQQDSSTGIE